tara:strand:+ start:1407 stop:2177 length:771 start_codon:yes stop_codon:yes gene_type:complete
MKYSYRDQIDILSSIRINDGEKKSLDCPFCGGRKKFGIAKTEGKLLWNCFKASCGVKGSYNAGRGSAEVKAYLRGKETKAVYYNTLPAIVSSIDNHPEALSYVRSVNSLEAYENGWVKIKYAPRDGRVLFYTGDGKGAVGRALDGRTPKWYTYGDTSKGIQVGQGIPVLVEDAPSACSVARVEGYCGYALLGTRLTQTIKRQVMHFESVLIVLDKDANSKAVLMARGMQSVCRASVRFTDEDLKCLSTEQIHTLLQ